MAATLTPSGELTYVSFGIEKTETTPDGDLLVWGKASDGSLDSDEQIVDPDFSAKAIRDWLATGANVRVQHNAQRDPAGIGVEAETDPEGATWVKSLVMEPVAKRLVEKGALRAYSVGIARPKIVRDSVARGGRIVDGEICEISLVDRPANKNCTLQLLKAAKDGAPEWVGKVYGGDVLTKSSGGDVVSVDLPADVSVSFSPADLAKLLEHRRVAEQRQAAKAAAEPELEKRDVDPDVGGGVDRDKLKDSDFVFPDERVFPVVTPADVTDAVSSWGRYQGPESFETFKEKLTALAHRKGDAFTAKLPQKWDGKPASKTDDQPAAAKAKKGKKKPFPGAHEPFTAEHQHGDGDVDEEDKQPAAKTAEPETAKGAKTCTGCGKGYDADSKMRRCEGCGKKLPKANKAATAEEAPVDDAEKTAEPAVAKSDDVMCVGCGHKLDDDDKFCSECGKPAGVGKASKPTPGEGVVGAGTDPVPAHREPDGPFIEALERDAQLPTAPDGPHLDPSLKAAQRLKSLSVPNDMGALHDLLCAAFHPDAAVKAHPGHGLAALDVDAWQAKALDAAVSAPLDQARTATQMWQHAVTLKSAPADMLEDLRAEAHKAFRDANPGPGSFPQPTELSPARFNRPYIAAGHASPGTAYDGPISAAVPSGHAQAADYQRGPLAAGHAEDSPSNKGAAAMIEPAPLPPGMGRTYYTNAQRDSARSAMAAMHDHIAQTFPDLCPMSGPGVGGEPAAGARPVPVPAGMGKNAGLTDRQKAKAVKKARKAYNEALAALGIAAHDFAAPEVTKAAATPASSVAVDPDVIKAAVAEATAPLAAKIAEQAKLLDQLAELPDPREAAFRGVAHQTTTATKTAGLPAGARTVAESAEQAQFAVMRAMQEEARNNPDPAQREAAWAHLYKMAGLPAQ